MTNNNRANLIRTHLSVSNSICKSTSQLIEEYRIHEFLEAIADDPIALTQLTIQIQGLLQKTLTANK